MKFRNTTAADGYKTNRHPDQIEGQTYYDTYSHMKTTIEISDSLLDKAKKLAAKEGTTLRAYVEQGLRRILAERKSRGVFRLRKATFKGKGLQPGVQDATRERIRETIYQGRGG
jgi:hypothetical protein